MAYVAGENAPSITQWAADRASAPAVEPGFPTDVRITAEPGRSIVATAGMTLYRVGTIKELPGLRTYVAVDGGMSDNPRPVLYGSGYEAFLPRERRRAPAPGGAGGGQALRIGRRRRGRRPACPPTWRWATSLATPVTGAYGYSMASNYNKVPRPAVVFVADGDARVWCGGRPTTT